MRRFPCSWSPLPRKGSSATTVTSTQLPERWLHDISERYHQWVRNQAERWKVPILEYPEGRREDMVAPYFTRAQPDRMVAIIKSREPANILVRIGGRDTGVSSGSEVAVGGAVQLLLE